jgi:hypothetical protein
MMTDAELRILVTLEVHLAEREFARAFAVDRGVTEALQRLRRALEAAEALHLSRAKEKALMGVRA